MAVAHYFSLVLVRVVHCVFVVSVLLLAAGVGVLLVVGHDLVVVVLGDVVVLRVLFLVRHVLLELHQQFVGSVRVVRLVLLVLLVALLAATLAQVASLGIKVQLDQILFLDLLVPGLLLECAGGSQGRGCGHVLVVIASGRVSGRLLGSWRLLNLLVLFRHFAFFIEGVRILAIPTIGNHIRI